VPADLVGRGLALTVQSFEKNWDQNRILQLENLRVSPSALEYEQQDGQKIYTVDLVLDNKNPPEIKLYLSDLIGNHYLAVCDAEDFVYPLTVISAGPADTIPFGKNRFRFMAAVPESAEITHARFVREKIPLK